jgi:hypothetical protein
MKKTLTTLSLALAMVPFTFAAQSNPPAAGSTPSTATTAKPAAAKTKKHAKPVSKKNSTAAPKSGTTAGGASK